MRPWLEKLGPPSLEGLNRLAEAAGIRTASGRAVRFVPPGAASAYYEVEVFETGCVQTRPDNLHDLFNALAWLAFPATKALINALHAEEIPREQGRRGRRRDLLTLLDEGGAIVQCDDPGLIDLMRNFRWKELFWERRETVRRAMRIRILGHAILEQAMRPWPGITCKALVIPQGADPDAAASAFLENLPRDATPRMLPPLPVFGYPGWLSASERAGFYDDTRYFRPVRERRGKAEPVPPALPRDGAR